MHAWDCFFRRIFRKLTYPVTDFCSAKERPRAFFGTKNPNFILGGGRFRKNPVHVTQSSNVETAEPENKEKRLDLRSDRTSVSEPLAPSEERFNHCGLQTQQTACANSAFYI